MSKVRYLDGVRGVGALIVVFHHYTFGFYPALVTHQSQDVHFKGEILLSNSPLNLFWAGNMAVCIFFILSGYVLSYKFFKNHDYESLVSGAVKRYFRLIPPVFVSMLAAYVCLKASFFFNKEVAVITHSVPWMFDSWSFQGNFGEMLRNGLYTVLFTYDTKYNPILWTMGYEFFGSLLVFSFLALFGRIKHRWIAYVVLFFILGNSYYSNFFYGVVLCDLQNGEVNYLEKINYKIMNLLLVLIGLYVNSKYWQVERHMWGAFLIMLAVLNSKLLKSFFSTRPIHFLGKVSFSMYVIHYVLQTSFSCFVFKSLLAHMNYHLSFILMFFSSLVVIIGVSYLMHLFVDSKGVQFAEFIYQRFFKKSFSDFIEKGNVTF